MSPIYYALQRADDGLTGPAELANG